MSKVNLLKYGTEQELHCHTVYCDGKNTPEEMVLAAIENGMHALGFSTHSYTSRDLTYCIRKEKIEDYKNLDKKRFIFCKAVTCPVKRIKNKTRYQ